MRTVNIYVACTEFALFQIHLFILFALDRVSSNYIHIYSYIYQHIEYNTISTTESHHTIAAAVDVNCRCLDICASVWPMPISI